uniref:ribosomal protein S9 n=1 Tax=Madagascaria erythrocladioides TaxID=753684 RepID=UPI001BF02AE6|nr:ribosomal protein S9 [Madagascaria erythrocladioides]QUE29038.1 ribosomal protein S9 [Madagascaria erythrocladioides]UNJ16593.1 ribosomal protein S9 [Madagascaria erythrocladioides]
MNQDNIKIMYYGTGRRKTAIARVIIKPGNGKLKINGINGEKYLQYNPNYLKESKHPLLVLGLEGDYDISVNSHGGGLTGQAQAIKLGLARALCKMNTEYRTPLKSEGDLSRDSRSKERRKYGLRKARKAPQYSKR